MDLAIALTLVAAMLLGVGWVLQQYAAEQAPNAYFLRLRLIVDLLHRRRWLLGLAVMISGQLLSAWSVGHLDLTLYEPLLASSRRYRRRGLLLHSRRAPAQRAGPRHPDRHRHRPGYGHI